MANKSSKIKLTQNAVASALRNRDQATIYRDTELPGFQLRVAARSATYYLDYKPTGLRPDGRQFASKSVKIGTVQSHSVAQARTEAARLKAEVSAGGDPAADRKAAKVAKAQKIARTTTMAEAAEAYIANTLKGGDKHITTEGGALRLGIKEMGVEALPPEAVTLQDVMRLLNLHNGLACAMHRFGALNRFFDDLLARDMVPQNPCARVSKRHKPKPPQPRSKTFSASEMRSLWHCDVLSGVQLRLLRTLMLLPLRFGEACNLVASEVEPENGRLVLPGKRTKNGDAFALPVPDQAMQLIDVGDPQGDPRVFPLTSPGKEFTSWSGFTRKVRKGSGVEDFNFHHLRRTFSTVLGEQGVGDTALTDALLNHRQSATRSGVIAAYNHATLWPQKTRVMQIWANLVGRAVETGRWDTEASVVPLRGRLGD